MNTANKEKHSKRDIRRQRKYKNMLLADLAAAKRELDNAQRNINFVKDDLLLDHYIFRMKAYEMRYRYILSLIRQTDNSCGGADNERIEDKAL